MEPAFNVFSSIERDLGSAIVCIRSLTLLRTSQRNQFWDARSRASSAATCPHPPGHIRMLGRSPSQATHSRAASVVSAYSYGGPRQSVRGQSPPDRYAPAA